MLWPTARGEKHGHCPQETRNWVEGPFRACPPALRNPAPDGQVCRVEPMQLLGGQDIPASVVREAMQAATAAPSVHNTQPWLFRLRSDGVDVFVDRRRQLISLDPD